jgi:hypothetical protein
MGMPLGRLVGWYNTREIRELYETFMVVDKGLKRPKKAEVVRGGNMVWNDEEKRWRTQE